jgi:hypothetical protein
VTIVVITLNPSEKLVMILGGGSNHDWPTKKMQIAAWSILLHGKRLTNVTSFDQNSVRKGAL